MKNFSPHDIPPLSIIVADGDHDDCYILSHLLTEVIPNCNLTYFHDGVSLIEHLEWIVSNQDKSKLPDLIFLDLNMPRRTGEECLKKIRQTEIYKNLPVIIYTTAESGHITDDYYRMGATSYIQKHTNVKRLKESIRLLLAEVVERKEARQ